jgi:hypothetical protein
MGDRCSRTLNLPYAGTAEGPLNAAFIFSRARLPPNTISRACMTMSQRRRSRGSTAGASRRGRARHHATCRVPPPNNGPRSRLILPISATMSPRGASYLRPQGDGHGASLHLRRRNRCACRGPAGAASAWARVRDLPARTALHARAGAEMAREARRRPRTILSRRRARRSAIGRTGRFPPSISVSPGRARREGTADDTGALPLPRGQMTAARADAADRRGRW